MIQTIVVLVVIFAGVAFSVYQVYDIYYSQNFGDDEKLAQQEAAGAIPAGERSAVNTRRLQQAFPEEIVAAAMRDEALSHNPEPLLRRRRSVVFDHGIKVRYLSLWTAKPVTRHWRKCCLIVVLVNCLVAMFLGGLSLYTVAYRVPGEAFAWMNDHVIVLVLLIMVILLTHGVAKLDFYLHDLYRIGRLNRYVS